MLVTVIGRGHGGTRAMSHTLAQSGVYMGSPNNVSGDLLPPEDMYEACQLFARYVDWRGGCEWSWDRALAIDPDPAFVRLVESYLSSVLSSDTERKGWKLPETTLAYPWICKMFPDIFYIEWLRDPRDSILTLHPTDDLSVFGIEYERTTNLRLRRAISWKYQRDIMRATPRPSRVIQVRFEDFVLRQEATLTRLETFLGFELARIPVRNEAVGRWRSDTEGHDFEFLKDDQADWSDLVSVLP